MVTCETTMLYMRVRVHRFVVGPPARRRCRWAPESRTRREEYPGSDKDPKCLEAYWGLRPTGSGGPFGRHTTYDNRRVPLKLPETKQN